MIRRERGLGWDGPGRRALRGVGAALLAGGVAGGLAGLAAVPVAAQTTPYVAEAAADTVPVRSGAGRAYYPVGRLERGARVRVEAELFGWFQIRTPAGVRAYVERKNVDLKGDGTRGEVNTDRTGVYAAHEDSAKPPAESYRKLVDLDRGDVVRIVGTVDNYYTIEPPENAFVFVPPQALVPAADGGVPEPVRPGAGGAAPADPVTVSSPDPDPEAGGDPGADEATDPQTPPDADRPAVRLAPVVSPDAARRGAEGGGALADPGLALDPVPSPTRA